MREHVTDAFVKRAQSAGFRSRAAYKLLQLATRDKLLKPGTTVVDLGAAPGGWAQVAAKAVHPGGSVVALDVLDMAPIPGVAIVRGDFEEESALQALEQLLHEKRVDLVLSDMAPNMSGIPSVDQARSLALAELALEFAVKRLKPRGNFLVKAFQGSGYERFVKRMREHFDEVLVRKPEASRSRSSEVYLLGKGLRRH
jgi:23S rRNA (uridine2552-2'-O)-methyltransferase